MKRSLIIYLLLAVCAIAIGRMFPVESFLNPTPAQRLYMAINHFAPQYEVPLKIAFNVARLETGYLGPHHNNYNHKQTSSAGCLGPMQIMPRYASHYAGFKVPKEMLKDSIELNVEISMKMLQQWYKKHKSWDKAAGAYNTGRPILNKYARRVAKEDHLSYWVQPNTITLTSRLEN